MDCNNFENFENTQFNHDDHLAVSALFIIPKSLPTKVASAEPSGAVNVILNQQIALRVIFVLIIIFDDIFVLGIVFIGPRCNLGPIYGSGWLSLTIKETLLKLNWCDSGWRGYQVNATW